MAEQLAFLHQAYEAFLGAREALCGGGASRAGCRRRALVPAQPPRRMAPSRARALTHQVTGPPSHARSQRRCASPAPRRLGTAWRRYPRSCRRRGCTGERAAAAAPLVSACWQLLALHACSKGRATMPSLARLCPLYCRGWVADEAPRTLPPFRRSNALRVLSAFKCEIGWEVRPAVQPHGRGQEAVFWGCLWPVPAPHTPPQLRHTAHPLPRFRFAHPPTLGHATRGVCVLLPLRVSHLQGLRQTQHDGARRAAASIQSLSRSRPTRPLALDARGAPHP
jgi:hypothetical protein